MVENFLLSNILHHAENEHNFHHSEQHLHLLWGDLEHHSQIKVIHTSCILDRKGQMIPHKGEDQKLHHSENDL